MKVFSAFMKIAKKNVVSIVMYLVLIIIVSSFTAQQNSKNNVSSFESKKTTIAVIDRDHTETSAAFKNYIGELQTLVELEDDKKVLQDALCFRAVHYILYLPEGFETSLINGEDIKLDTVEVPGSTAGIYLNMQMNQILSSLKNYLTLENTPSEAMQKTKDLMTVSASVSIHADSHVAKEVPTYYAFFALLPYAFLGLIITVIGLVLIAFNQPDLKKRTIASALSLRSRNMQITLGSIILSVGVLVVVFLVPLLLYGPDYLSDPLFGYILLNAVANLTFCVALGYLIGTISTKADHITIASTSLSLALSFIGGVFVPLSIMPKQVQIFSRFFPTYWYTTASDTLIANMTLSDVSRNNVLFSIAIQFGFALLTFGAAIILTKKKSQE